MQKISAGRDVPDIVKRFLYRRKQRQRGPNHNQYTEQPDFSLICLGEEPRNDSVEVLGKLDRFFWIIAAANRALEGCKVGLGIYEILYILPDVTVSWKRLKYKKRYYRQGDNSEDCVIRQSGGLLA
jgi:hypothetical protein